MIVINIDFLCPMLEKTKIQKQTRNSSFFGVAQSDNHKNHQTPK
jgi:hypothetical protein